MIFLCLLSNGTVGRKGCVYVSVHGGWTLDRGPLHFKGHHIKCDRNGDSILKILTIAGGTA